MESDLQGKTALIVDDDAIYCQLTVELLQGHGVDCHTASDGEQGFELAKSRVFDYILMDVKLPLVDGLTATRKLRQQYAENMPTRIIAFTSLDLDNIYEDITEAGFHGYVHKPFREESLLAALRAVA